MQWSLRLGLCSGRRHPLREAYGLPEKPGNGVIDIHMCEPFGNDLIVELYLIGSTAAFKAKVHVPTKDSVHVERALRAPRDLHARAGSVVS